MKLNTLLQSRLIIEDDIPKWGNKEYFDYTKIRKKLKETTTPTILYLGTWNRKLKSGQTKKYWCAIELNTLDNEQLSMLRQYLPEILKSKSIKRRYWTGKSLLPDIFVNLYRTYRIENISHRIKGRLYALDVKKIDKVKAIEQSELDGKDFSSLDATQKSVLISKAIRERGTKEEQQQQDAAIERLKDQEGRTIDQEGGEDKDSQL